MKERAFWYRACAGGLSVLSVMFGTAHANEDAALRLRLSALLAMPFASDMVGAAQAKRLAWVERRNGVRNVMVSDAGGVPYQASAYTKDDGTPLWGLALAPDGGTLAYVEGGDPEVLADPPPILITPRGDRKRPCTSCGTVARI